MVKLYLLLLLAVLTAVIVSTRWLPWWGAAVAIPFTVLLLIWLTVWLIKRWFARIVGTGIEGMSVRAAALHGAEVEIHSCEPAGEPASVKEIRERYEESQHESHGLASSRHHTANPDTRRWVAVEMTVQPDRAGVEEAMKVIRENETDGRLKTRFPPTWTADEFRLMPSSGTGSSELDAYVVRVQRLSESGDVEFDTDAGIGRGGSLEKFPPMIQAARVRVTFEMPAGLHGPVRLVYFGNDLRELTLPPR